MRVPDLVYSFVRPKDISGPPLEILARSAINSGAVTVTGAAFGGIPKDKILVLSTATVVAIPGLAQSVINISVLGTQQAGNAVTIAQQQFVPVANQQQTFNFSGDAWILGGATDTVTITAQFDAGVAVNTAIVGIYGWLIPRANVAVF